jgi:CheY-like chemotaxis protein
LSNLTNTLLIVDDNEDDLYALRRALKKAAITNPQQVLIDGHETIDYLSGAGIYADRDRFPLPFLVFLDLKTPVRDGFEVLAWIQQQPALRELAVVVLSGSVEDASRQNALALGARAFLTKPPSESDLYRVMEAAPGPWQTSGAGNPLASSGR